MALTARLQIHQAEAEEVRPSHNSIRSKRMSRMNRYVASGSEGNLSGRMSITRKVACPPFFLLTYRI